jgi:hypothetical protein
MEKKEEAMVESMRKDSKKCPRKFQSAASHKAAKIRN